MPRSKERSSAPNPRDILLTDSRVLIPKILLETDMTTGQVQVLFDTRRRTAGLRFAVIDEQIESIANTDATFKYLEEDVIDEFPTLCVNKLKRKRVLVYGSLSRLTPQILFCGMIEVHPSLRGKGVGTSFYQGLEGWAGTHGYEFLTGYHGDAETAQFFLNRGRYFLDELRPEHQPKFKIVLAEEEDDQDSVFFTVKFLRATDAAKYVRPEKLTESIESRLTEKHNRVKLYELCHLIEGQLRSFTQPSANSEFIFAPRSPQEETQLLAKLIEILEEMNLNLPTEQQYQSTFGTLRMSELLSQKALVVSQLQEFVRHLQTHIQLLCQHTSLKQSLELRELLFD